MKLTSFTDYSLRVLIYLAADPRRRTIISEISTSFAISENHLTKVVHFLAKHGWVSTVRGKGGGLMLAKAPASIGLGDVVRDTEGAAMPAECFALDEGNCAISQYCRLRGVLGEAVDAFYAVLDRYTLADITRNRQLLSQVLHFHEPAAVAAARSRRGEGAPRA
jgi:Rrf2 family nitric oxide-sensitive transcriptional repressor